MNIYVKKQDYFWQKVLVGVGILIALILFLNIFESPVRNYFYIASAPVTKIFLKSGNATFSFFAAFFPNENMKKENMLLRQENQKLLSRLAIFQDSLSKDYLNQGASQIAKEHSFILAMVHIIALDVSDDFLFIDKGLKDGISESMPVISSENVLYGKVHQVYDNFSKVMLISNSASVFDVKVQNDAPSKKPVYGAIKGISNRSLYLDLVSSESEINEGDVLVTSALEGSFPRNILVGRIVSKDKNDLKPFQTAKVDHFFDVKNTDTLFVITNYKK